MIFTSLLIFIVTYMVIITNKIKIVNDFGDYFHVIIIFCVLRTWQPDRVDVSARLIVKMIHKYKQLLRKGKIGFQFLFHASCKHTSRQFGDREIATSGYLALLVFCFSSMEIPVLPATRECQIRTPGRD
jgi:hypothetical protein